MPYVPTPEETRRLYRAIELAKFAEGERIGWLASFVSLVALDVVLLASGTTWLGTIGSLIGFVLLYWRLRGGHWAGREPIEDLEGLFGFSLTQRDQRAFTALMLRQVLTGKNPLGPRTEHDPFATWKGTPLEKAAREAQ